MIDGKGISPDIAVKDPLYQDTIDISSLTGLTGEKLLKSGSVGYEVLCAERLLEIMGYMKGTPDVVYDAETVKAVKSFQLSVKIKADGIIGPVTRKLINRNLNKAVLKYDAQYSKALEELAG
jgi:carboxyl-terminal processing protease